MGLFDIFRKKKESHKTVAAIPEDRISDVLHALEKWDTTDYLGMAAKAESKGNKAVHDGKYDEAWKHFHNQKAHYLKHAKSSEFSPRQTIALDGSVHENLVNVLRLEGKHDQALVHFTYCLATTPRVTKAQEKKILAYLNRASLTQEAKSEYKAFLADQTVKPNFKVIQAKICEWKE